MESGLTVSGYAFGVGAFARFPAGDGGFAGNLMAAAGRGRVILTLVLVNMLVFVAF